MAEIGDTVYLAATRTENGKVTHLRAQATVIEKAAGMVKLEFIPGVTMVAPEEACLDSP
jgi:hypothetical protein